MKTLEDNKKVNQPGQRKSIVNMAENDRMKGKWQRGLQEMAERIAGSNRKKHHITERRNLKHKTLTKQLKCGSKV